MPLRLHLTAQNAPVDVVLGDSKPERCKSIVQPDLLVISKGAHKAFHHGPPPFVLEILSPGTRRHDEVIKLALYEKYGVGEVWLVDTDAHRVTAFRRSGDVYLAGDQFVFDQPLEIKSLGVYVNLRDVATALEQL